MVVLARRSPVLARLPFLRFSRKGLGEAITMCPECGVSWARSPGSQPWATTLDWALRLILWSVGIGMFGAGLRGSLPGSAFSGSAAYLFNVTAWLLLPIAGCVWLATRELARALDGRASRVARASMSTLLILLIIVSTGIDELILNTLYALAGARGTRLGSSYFTSPVVTCCGLIVAAGLIGALASAGVRLGFGDRARRAGLIAIRFAEIGCGATLLRFAVGIAFWDKAWSNSERTYAEIVNQLSQALDVAEHTVTVLLWLGVWLGTLALRQHLHVARAR